MEQLVKAALENAPCVFKFTRQQSKLKNVVNATSATRWRWYAYLGANTIGNKMMDLRRAMKLELYCAEIVGEAIELIIVQHIWTKCVSMITTKL